MYAVQPNTAGWPGTKTNCFVEPETNTLDPADSTTWATSPATWDAWTSWIMVPSTSITYDHTVIDVGAVVKFTPVISAVASGAQTITVSTSSDNITYSSYVAAGSQVTARYIKVRLNVTGTFPTVTSMNIMLNGAAKDEYINDLLTSSLIGAQRLGVGDIRLPITKTYSVISQLQIALQGTGPGWSWEVIDKSTSGPRIKIYNASNALADATIDAYVRGF
jgi:hypothetical protein